MDSHLSRPCASARATKRGAVEESLDGCESSRHFRSKLLWPAVTKSDRATDRGGLLPWWDVSFRVLLDFHAERPVEQCLRYSEWMALLVPGKER